MAAFSPQLVVHFSAMFLSVLTLFYYAQLCINFCLYPLAAVLAVSGSIDILRLGILTSAFQSVTDMLDDFEASMISQTSEVAAAKDQVEVISKNLEQMRSSLTASKYFQINRKMFLSVSIYFSFKII